MPDGKVISKQIPIKWVVPDDVVPRVVQNVVCSYQDGVYMISFYEIWQPEVVGKSPEETQRMLNSYTEVEAKCVSRIVVTPKTLTGFITAMQQATMNAEKILTAQVEVEKKL